MAIGIVYMNANNVWANLLEDLIENGKPSSPRDMDSLELIGYQSVIDMDRPVISWTARKINKAFMFGEAWWIMSGSPWVSDISEYMKAIKKFSDDGVDFDGAYGPKVVQQYRYVVDTLTFDNDSRQAVMSIWERNPRTSKDIPCTLTLQFILRDGKLHCVANMRSSDAWLGYVYDIFNFSMISRYIAIELRARGVPVESMGSLTMNCGSQHLYARNIDQAKEIVEIAAKAEGNIVTPDIATPTRDVVYPIYHYLRGIDLIQATKEGADYYKYGYKTKPD